VGRSWFQTVASAVSGAASYVLTPLLRSSDSTQLKGLRLDSGSEQPQPPARDEFTQISRHE